MSSAPTFPGPWLANTLRLHIYGREEMNGSGRSQSSVARVGGASGSGSPTPASVPFRAMFLHQAAAALSFVSQMGVLASHMGGSHTLAVRAAVGASAVVQCCILLLMLLAPAAYWANR